MPFDEDLRRQFETRTDRLRDEVTRQLTIATGELTASVEAERAAAALHAAAAAARLTEAVAAAEDRGRDTGREEGRQNGLAQGRQEGRDEARGAERAAGERLVEAFRAIDRARSLVLSRLGGGIARARVLYEQRVPARIRSATDHFHAELVPALANGDPALLGQTT